MPGVLEGAVALVTGASRGIGRGIAVGLGEAGATVVVTGRSLQPDGTTDPVGGSLAETCAAVEAAGGRCRPVAVDHTDDAQVEALFARIRQDFDGRLDVLVNNVYGGVRALRESMGQPFWEADPGLWDACNGVGLRSHYIASVHAAQLMVPRRCGLICTISSWGGLFPLFNAAYGTGKAACDRLAAEMAAELRPHGVTSLALWPGIVGTEHIRELAEESRESGSRDRAIQALASQANWETPLLSGRVIAALAADPDLLRRSGTVGIVAELAATYGVVDAEGRRPASLRSLRAVLPAVVPALASRAGWIPDLRVPWWLLLLAGRRAPRF
ncbi:SDR family NAD(P)-dependent oxidoreductase [Cyanobium sp. NIES-981]|uniref:SDR family NAD(P)-dependent oxidoreductase n=1 Tax=Cyanobium sp. NIES-981 TaxID=1851505 RepID=UPI0007DCF06F|nr:SDR family NAD(P)-dependent oxidoreductase [Cyanobium sp. NIES-981]SBO43357.1 Short-chain dehydrogenase/reductase SDR [Cyanobium sp. NIES-981]